MICLITECLKQCLKDINLLHLKVDAISESIDSLVKNTSKKEVKLVSSPSETLPILELLPMDSTALIKVEEWLRNAQNKANLVL